MLKPSAPLSPHLQHYKLPLNAWLSVFHRLTGAIVYFGFLLLALVLVVASTGEGSWRIIQPVLQHGLTQVLFFILTLGLYFHCFNGLRHLFWDIGKGFDSLAVARSAKLAIIAALFFNVLTWLIIWL